MTSYRDLIKEKSTTIEQDSRHVKEQLAEMVRTATQYSTIIQQKEEDIARLVSDLAFSKREREKSFKQTRELQADIDTLMAESEAQKNDRDIGTLARAKFQEEVDELRALMDAKTSEDSRRTEVEKGKEQEISDLRGQVVKLQADLHEARKMGLEGQSKLKVELDNSVRAFNALQEIHTALMEREQAAKARLVQAEGGLFDLEKAKRALESELQSVRSRQIDADGHLGEAIRAKEVHLVFHLADSVLIIYLRDWNVSSFMRSRNAKTSKTQCYSLNERRPLMIDN